MSERDDLTRLRVAQAARVPVTAEMVARQLDPDEAAHSWSAEEVEPVLGELVEEGLLEALPGSNGAPARYVQRALFEGDVGRRIVSVLAAPRNVAAIQHELRGDPQVGELPREYIEQVLERARRAGLVECLGVFDDAGELAATAREDEATAPLKADQAKALAARLAHPTRAWRMAGEQWQLTVFGRTALQAIA